MNKIATLKFVLYVHYGKVFSQLGNYVFPGRETKSHLVFINYNVKLLIKVIQIICIHSVIMEVMCESQVTEILHDRFIIPFINILKCFEYTEKYFLINQKY